MSWSVISRPIGSVEKIGIAPAHFSRGMVGVEILKANNRCKWHIGRVELLGDRAEGGSRKILSKGYHGPIVDNLH